MRLYNAKDYEEMSRIAANIIAAQVMLKPDSVLGLATGSTPLGIYRELIEKYRKGDVDFSKVTSINLDEYCGLPSNHDQSYYYFMHENLFKDINIVPENTHIPNGMEEDMKKECLRYEEVMKEAGGIDLQLLGLGRNGHIGFNEPGEVFEKITHSVNLTESTIEANKRFFASADDVPRKAVTMGIGSIMKAKKILLVVNGESKAEILKDALLGPVTPWCPASILQFHPDVTVVADEAAMSVINQ